MKEKPNQHPIIIAGEADPHRLFRSNYTSLDSDTDLPCASWMKFKQPLMRHGFQQPVNKIRFPLPVRAPRLFPTCWNSYTPRIARPKSSITCNFSGQSQFLIGATTVKRALCASCLYTNGNDKPGTGEWATLNWKNPTGAEHFSLVCNQSAIR